MVGTLREELFVRLPIGYDRIFQFFSCQYKIFITIKIALTFRIIVKRQFARQFGSHFNDQSEGPYVTNQPISEHDFRFYVIYVLLMT